MSQSTHLKLVEAVGGGDNATPTPATPKSFVEDMLHDPDPKMAATLVGEQAGLEFDIAFGQELQTKALEQDMLDKRYEVMQKEVEALDKKIKATPRFIKVHASQNAEDIHWSLFDRASFALALMVSALCLYLGAANVYAIMMISGEPLFIENPLLVISLSLLVPAASVALKYLSNLFYYANSKKLYTRIIMGATAVLCLAWTVSFATQYSGATGGMELDFGESSAGANVLVWLQLVCEMMVASSLFLAAESIYLKHDPELIGENPEFTSAQASLKTQLAALDALSKKRGENHAAQAVLRAKREAAMNEAVARYLAKRSRFNAL